MPELPEVEIYRRHVERNALNQRVRHVRVLDRRILRDVNDRALEAALVGRRFLETRRHGKHLFVGTGKAPWLYLHFGMTGDIRYYEGDEEPQFSKVIFDFPRGAHLAFEDARLFGAVSLVDDPDEFIREKRLGPDPFSPEFRPTAFKAALRSRSGGIKALLMSQLVVAGLGNLYVDEVLYQVGIQPLRRLPDLEDSEIPELFRAIGKVLRLAIDRGEKDRALPSSWLLPNREQDVPCPRCSTPISRAVVAGRTTYFCPGHQR